MSDGIQSHGIDLPVFIVPKTVVPYIQWEYKKRECLRWGEFLKWKKKFSSILGFIFDLQKMF